MAGHAFLSSLVFAFLCLYSCVNCYHSTAFVSGTIPGYWCAILSAHTKYFRISTRCYLFRGNLICPKSTEICILDLAFNEAVPGDATFTMAGQLHLCVVNKVVLKPLFKRKWLKGRIPYYSNSDASFNFLEFRITLSGDVHPLP